MKKVILTLLILLFFIAIFMVVNMPARWVYNQFINKHIVHYPVLIEAPQGTIWQGKTVIATKNNLPIKAIAQKVIWRWDYQKLLELKFVYQIDIQSVFALGKNLGDFRATMGIDMDNFFVHFNDVVSVLEVKANYTHKNKTISGKVNLKREDNELNNLLKFIPNRQGDGSFNFKFN